MKAITDVKAFAALLGGGYICKISTSGEKRLYKVYASDPSAQLGFRHIGHITEKQFTAFMQENILTDMQSHEPLKKDKSGTYCMEYILAPLAWWNSQMDDEMSREYDFSDMNGKRNSYSKRLLERLESVEDEKCSVASNP